MYIDNIELIFKKKDFIYVGRQVKGDGVYLMFARDEFELKRKSQEY